MINLLNNYSLTDIIIFIVLFSFALKEFFSFFQWLQNKGVMIFNHKYKKPKEIQQNVKNLTQIVENLSKKVDILIDSDKDDIKAFITRQHHYFCYKVGSIDDQSLDCIEKRYCHYKEQGGNSYIHNLMEQLRRLPRDININTP